MYTIKLYTSIIKNCIFNECAVLILIKFNLERGNHVYYFEHTQTTDLIYICIHIYIYKAVYISDKTTYRMVGFVWWAFGLTLFFFINF